MSSPRVVLDLPVRALVNVLTVFVTLPVIGRLDAAYCAHSSRKSFTTILSSKELTFDVDFKSSRYITRCMRWSISRQIKFSAVTFSQSPIMPDRVVMNFFELNRMYLKELREICRVGCGLAAIMHMTSGVYQELHTLELHGTVGARNVVILLKKCPNLVTFAACGTPFPFQQSEGSYFIGAYCPNVTSVTLTEQFHDKNLIGITGCFPNISALDITGTVSAGMLVNIIVSYRNLRSLIVYASTDLNDGHMDLIAQGCPHITHLILEYSYILTQESVAVLSKYCPLQSVELIGCDRFESSVLSIIATELRSTLTVLSIAGCSSMRGVRVAALKQCTLLESLDISHTSVNLRNFPEVLQTCTQLRTLKLDGLDVTDDILCAVAQYCAHIQGISIVGCYVHPKVGILTLARHAHSLKEIVVGPLDPVLNELAIELMHLQFPRLRISLPPQPVVRFATPSEFEKDDYYPYESHDDDCW